MAKGQKIHVGVDLRGARLNRNATEWIGVVTEGGKTLSPREVKIRFLDLLVAGVKVIPMDSSCDNFDPEHGCQGHECELEDNG